jgi:riboflavin-specific deaminase-like protein
VRLLLGDPSVEGDPTSVYLTDRAPVEGRPWVFANMVAGLDGSAAFEGRVGELSAPSDRTLFVLLRSLADVVLVGAGTVRAEGYGPVKLKPDQREARRERGQPERPPIAVVSRSLQLDFEAPLFADDVDPRTILVTADAAGDEALARARQHADVLVAGDERVDLADALRQLGARGHRAVLTEGGPALLSELISGGLLDELCLTLAPAIGGDPLAVAEAGGERRLSRFDLASVLEDEANLFLRYLARRS